MRVFHFFYNISPTIVITSSVVSIYDVASPSKSVYTEKDWNEKSVKDTKEKGKYASALTKYSASKTLAEQGKTRVYAKVLKSTDC